MGKGNIQINRGSGRYSITVIYGQRDRVNERIDEINAQITYVDQKISGLPEGDEKNRYLLQKLSLEKELFTLQKYMPEDRFLSAIWCVDKSEDLSGDVGLIEVPAEWDRKNITLIMIRPGYFDNAVYNDNRDKILVPQIAQSTAQWFYNRAVLPGSEKWQPRYRFGTIVNDSIDFDADTCSVCLDPTYSSQQNLDVNQAQGFSSCDQTPPSGFNQFCSDNPSHPT